jgi:phosphoglycerate dehydrogenase-like enzyme
VALASADWSAVAAHHELDVITEHIADEAELTRRLAGSDVIVVMRERTAFPERVLAALPALRLLVTTGAKNAAIDVPAAKALGITVCGTRAHRSARRALRRPGGVLHRQLLLPHIGYVTTDNYREWYDQVVEDIVAFDAGRPLREL